MTTIPAYAAVPPGTANQVVMYSRAPFPSISLSCTKWSHYSLPCSVTPIQILVASRHSNRQHSTVLESNLECHQGS